MNAPSELRSSDMKSATSLSLSAEDRRLVESLAPYGHDVRFLSGNAVINTQHQGLFDEVNCLRAAILGGQPVDEVDAIIDTLIRDVVKHLQTEDAILAANGYPGIAKHAALHRGLSNNAAALVGRYRAGTLGIGELFQFLAHDVVVKHILDSDRECYRWLLPHKIPGLPKTTT